MLSNFKQISELEMVQCITISKIYIKKKTKRPVKKGKIQELE